MKGDIPTPRVIPKGYLTPIPTIIPLKPSWSPSKIAHEVILLPWSSNQWLLIYHNFKSCLVCLEVYWCIPARGPPKYNSKSTLFLNITHLGQLGETYLKLVYFPIFNRKETSVSDNSQLKKIKINWRVLLTCV